MYEKNILLSIENQRCNQEYLSVKNSLYIFPLFMADCTAYFITDHEINTILIFS